MNNVKISASIFPIEQFGKMGKIHSVFERSFNIQVGERLLNIANYQGYLASFGIYLDNDTFLKLKPYLQQGNVVKILTNGLIVYSREGVQKVQWIDYEVVSLTVHEFSFSDEQLQLLKSILIAQRLEEKIGLPYDSQTMQVVNTMQQSNNLAIEEWQEILKYLIGRGKGLTPSGDDILVAYLVMSQILGHQQVDTLKKALKQQQLSTTAISKEYILHSMNGAVNSLVYELFKNLQAEKGKEILEQNVQQIMKIGHSSGKDLCYGLLLALG